MESVKMLSYSFPEFKSLVIHGFCDLHIGSEQHESKRLKQYLAKVFEQDNHYAVAVGDLIDNGTKGSKTNVYGQKMSPDDQLDMVGELLEPYKKRFLCFVDGNHERRTKLESDIGITRRLAKELGCSDKYHDSMQFMKIGVGRRKNGHVKSPLYSVCCHHGALGNKLMLNNFASVCGADVFISGHTHRPGVEPLDRYDLDMNNGYATLKPLYVVTATSWMRYGGYGAEKMMKPNGVHPNWVTLRGDEWKIEVTQG